MAFYLFVFKHHTTYDEIQNKHKQFLGIPKSTYSTNVIYTEYNLLLTEAYPSIKLKLKPHH